MDPAEAILRRRQDKHYDPLVKWFEEVRGTASCTAPAAVRPLTRTLLSRQVYGGPLSVVEGLADATHPPHVYVPLREFAKTTTPWMKAATRVALGTVKSTVICMAFLTNFINVQQAFDASRVEEEFQIEEHGFVEDGHDTSRAHDKVKLGAVATFLWLLQAR